MLAIRTLGTLRRAGHRNGRLSLTVLAAGIMMWAVGCGDEPSEPDHQHAVSALTLSHSSVSLKTGESVTLSTAATCSCGEPSGATVMWSSSDPSIASVVDGVVSAVSFGSATITATAGGISASASVTVAPLGTVIGPAGGTVTSSDGNATLVVPAGALGTPIDVVLTAGDDAPFANDPLYVGGTAYRLGPATVQLQVRAQLQIRFDPARVPAGVYHEQLRIRERLQNQWREQEHAGLQGQIVAANIDTFGVFAILVQPAAGSLVGPQGGTVTSADGNLTLEVPAGALTALTDIVITKADDAVFGGDPAYVVGTGYQVDGTVLTVGASPGSAMASIRSPSASTPLQLQTRARIRIRYDPAHLPPGTFAEQLRIRTREQTQLQDCDHLGLQERMVLAWTNRLGLFGVFIQPPVGTMIGPLGGTAVSADGNVQLIIPAGAVDTVVDVVIVPADASLFAGDPLYVPGTAYQVLPEPLAFKVKAMLQLRFNAANVPGDVNHDRLRIRERDRVQSRWRDCTYGGMQGTVLMAQIEHTGVFGIVANAAPPAVASITIHPIPYDFLPVGATLQLIATARDASGETVTVRLHWVSSNLAVATVDDQTGLLRAVGPGQTIITAAVVGVTSPGVTVYVVGAVTPTPAGPAL